MRSSDPLVSVIVPTYNQQAFVRDALESVLDQDYRNLQVVVRDDGSRDATPLILQTLARLDPRIDLLAGGENLGVTRNCNRLLEACRGRHIAFFAGDDLFLPGKVRAQVAWLEASPDRVLCYHDVEVFDSDTGRTLYLHSARCPLRERSFVELLREPAMFASMSAMLRADCLPAGGYDPRLPRASDFLLFLQAMLVRGARHVGAGFVPGVLGRYRRHAANVTNQVDDYGLLEQLEMFRILEEMAPHAAREIRNARGERLATYGFRRILQGEARGGVALLIRSLGTSPRGFARSFRNAARYYLKRSPLHFFPRAHAPLPEPGA